MCLAIIATNFLRDWPLIVVANRDELHSRPTLPASPWSDATDILGGRDLSAGGTWLGIRADGRLALLTNYREPGRHDPQAPSRGQLTDVFLRGSDSARDYAAKLQENGHAYNGFNLFVADDTGVWYCSNREKRPAEQIRNTIVGISNASLDVPWPKLKRTRQAVSEYLERNAPAHPASERLFEIMQDTRSASLEELPDTGIGPEHEKLLGSPFIKNERYGTRCTTLIMRRADGQIRFHEKRYDAKGIQSGESLWTVDTVREIISEGTSKFEVRTL